MLFVPRLRRFPEVYYTAVYRRGGTCSAHVIRPMPLDGQPRSQRLDPRLDLWNHSPDGFGYGYPGAGPAQLALAILAHWLGPGREVLAVRLHQDFMRAAVAVALTSAPFIIDSEQIAAWIARDDSARG